MSTVRQRIIEQLVDNISNVVKDSYITPYPTNSTPRPVVTSSGTYSGTVPKKYTLTVTDAVNHIISTDIIVNGIPATFTITSGVPFSIGNGISITITFTTLVLNDKWTLRLNKSSNTLQCVLPWYSASDMLPMPHVLIYDTLETKEVMPIERYDCSLDIHLILRQKTVNRSTQNLNSLVGDIENEFNRDINLTDAFGNKLSYNLYVTRSEIFISEGSEEIVGAVIQCAVQYRHAFGNTSTIRN